MTQSLTIKYHIIMENYTENGIKAFEEFDVNMLNAVDIVELEYTVMVYNYLKKVFKQALNDKEYQEVFRKYFFDFYRVPRIKKDDYYEKLFSEDYSTYNLDNLERKAVELFDNKSVQFSFVTKMMNMHNEDYSIYDSFVAKAFGFKADSLPSDAKEKIGVLCGFYRNMEEVYRKLESHSKIGDFMAKIGDKYGRVSRKRALDLIFWQLGKK